MQNVLKDIDPYKAYKVKDIARLRLIPGMTSDNVVYNLIRTLVDKPDGTRKTVTNSETTKSSIRPVKQPVYGDKQVRCHYIWGLEIVKFLALNDVVDWDEAQNIIDVCQPQIDEMESSTEYSKYEGTYRQ